MIVNSHILCRLKSKPSKRLKRLKRFSSKLNKFSSKKKFCWAPNKKLSMERRNKLLKCQNNRSWLQSQHKSYQHKSYRLIQSSTTINYNLNFLNKSHSLSKRIQVSHRTSFYTPQLIHTRREDQGLEVSSVLKFGVMTKIGTKLNHQIFLCLFILPLKIAKILRNWKKS